MGTPANRTSVVLAVAQFALIGLAALALVGVAAALVLRDVGRSQAVDDAKQLTGLAGRGVFAPALAQAGMTGTHVDDVASLDRVVRARLLGQGGIVRVKLWRSDGTILYSDEHRLIGSRFPLGDDERESLRTWKTYADTSDLTAPENRYERAYGKLVEVYFPIVSPLGAPLLFEAYLRSSSVAASANQRWHGLLPALAGALGALWLVQLPLAWRLARRLQRGQDDRERLLHHAIESSNLERRRIASDLHDGAVQDLAGVAFSLAAAAQASEPAAEREREALRRGARETQRIIRRLRALLVDLYPPSLHRAGLAAALEDLASPLAGQGIAVELDLHDDASLPRTTETLLFRVAQESLRNVVRHADAHKVLVSFEREDGHAVLVVEDDGRGFDLHAAEERSREGHVGLGLLGELVRDAGARLDVDSQPDRGTRVRVEVPVK